MVFAVIFSLLLILNHSISTSHASDQINEVEFDHFNDTNFTFEAIVEGRRYLSESHQVTTEDGYILTINRIPHGRNNGTVSSKKKGVVFLQHGFSVSANYWIIPHNGLAYRLCDRGYDVWLGNARGTPPSRKHVSLDAEKDAPIYWDFSWDEIAYYDIPAMIDYVLKYTGQKKLFHVGHSQGATTFYAMNILKPEYNNKIIAHFSLTPIAFMNNLRSPILRTASYFEPLLNALYPMVGLYNPFQFCGDCIPQELCTLFLYAISGFNPKQFNSTLLPLIIPTLPAGASTKQLIHFLQLINSGHFRRFDNGIVGNLEKYGSETPPDYDLSKVTSPIYLFYSSNDWWADVTDVLRLARGLSNLKRKVLIPDLKWSHLDFLFGKEIDKYINMPILKIIQTY